MPRSGRSLRRDRLPAPVFSGFPGGSAGKESTSNVGDLGWSPGLRRSPGEGNGKHCSILARRIPRTVQSTRSQRAGHGWVAFTFTTDPARTLVVYLTLPLASMLPALYTIPSSLLTHPLRHHVPLSLRLVLPGSSLPPISPLYLPLPYLVQIWK